MTETDWLECSDARRMLEYQYRQALAEKPALLFFQLKFWRKFRPRGLASDRKLRLFACACCRSAWADLDDGTHHVIELAEEAADQRVSRLELKRAASRSRSPVAVWVTADAIHEQPSWLFLNWLATGSPEKQNQQLALLRDILGNPYRSLPNGPHWPLSVIDLAAALYQGQDCAFALHDALLEAGHAELAEHFRQETWHPKSCWVVDL